MKIQQFGKEVILLNKIIFILISSIFISCNNKKVTTKKNDLFNSEILNDDEYKFLYSISDYKTFSSDNVYKKTINDSIAFIRIDDKKNEIFAEGYINSEKNIKFDWWFIKFFNRTYKFYFVNGRIDQQIIFLDNELDSLQSYYFTLERNNNNLIFNYHEHKNTNNDSIFLDYSINNEKFNTIVLKKEGFKTTHIEPLINKSLPIVIKVKTLSIWKKSDYLYAREIYILDTIQ